MSQTPSDILNRRPDSLVTLERDRLRASVARGIFGDSTVETLPRVGRYVLTAKLGQGGMGTVYRATDPQLQRDVAVKLVEELGAKPDARRRTRARTLREARLLASLNHPNVVALHDFGKFEGGLYLAMELVEGGELGSWAEANPPTSGRRFAKALELMIEAGRGLVAAHNAGLIHRDFKPKNVLVGRDGRAKVADFGLARAMLDHPSSSSGASGGGSIVSGVSDISLSVAQSVTVPGAVVGTPAYMAPEQLQGQRVDVRTDVYAYCFTTYEILTGVRPFIARSAADLLERVREGRYEPTPGATNVPRAVAAVLRSGLSYSPGDRPQSVSSVVAVLERAQGRRRSWWVVAAGGVLAASALAVSAAGDRELDDERCVAGARTLQQIWNPTIAKRIRDRFSEVAADWGVASFERFETLASDYASRWTDASTRTCEATWVYGSQSADLLDARMRCLAGRRRSFAELLAAVETADAQSVVSAVPAVLKLPDVAPCTKVTVSQFRPPSDSDGAAAFEPLRQALERIRALDHLGEKKRALEVAQETYDQWHSAANPLLVAELLVLLGKIQAQAGDPKLAAEHLEGGFWRAFEAKSDSVMAEAATTLVMTTGVNLNQPEVGEAWAKRAAAAVARLGDDAYKPQMVLARYLAQVLRSQERPEEAELQYIKAMELARANNQENSASFAGLLESHAENLALLTRYEEAEAEIRRAIEIQERLLGHDHPQVAASLDLLGSRLVESGQFVEAQEVFERALVIRKRSYGERSRQVAQTYHGLVTLARSRGDVDKTIELARKALVIAEASTGNKSSLWAAIAYDLSIALSASGAQAEAAEKIDTILTNAEHAAWGTPSRMAVMLTFKSHLLALDGKFREALDIARGALEGQISAFGTKAHSLTYTLHQIGELELELERYEDAAETFERLIALRVAALGPDSRKLQQPRMMLARCRQALGDPQRQRALLDAIVATHADLVEPTPSERRVHEEAVAMLAALGPR